MTDQTRPMDAERIAEIEASFKPRRCNCGKTDAWPEHGLFCDALVNPMSRKDAEFLLAEVARLTAERDAALKNVPMPLGRDELGRELRESDYLRDQLADMTRERDEWKVGMRDAFGLHSKALAHVDSLAAELAHARAVIEEARDELDLIYDSGAMQVGANVKLIELFDRGLNNKGES